MSLSDRLARAARERDGGRTEPSAQRRSPAADEHQRTIILEAHIPAAAVEPDPAADPNAVCPTCGRTGELGIVDLARQTTDWSCLVCGTLWRVRQPASALLPYLR